jgi:cell shape-determining protein MreD
MAGKSLRKTISGNSEALRSNGWQLLLIFSAGILAVWFHEALRWPLNLPGRHGLELMAILMFVRLSAPQYYAATLAAMGGVSASLLFNDAAGVGSLILLAQGLFIDSAHRLLKHHSLTLWLMMVVTALAHMLKPMIKFGFQSGMGIVSDSLSHGLLYPLITHFSFGLIGGLAGLLAWRSLQKNKSDQP